MDRRTTTTVFCQTAGVLGLCVGLSSAVWGMWQCPSPQGWLDDPDPSPDDHSTVQTSVQALCPGVKTAQLGPTSLAGGGGEFGEHWLGRL